MSHKFIQIHNARQHNLKGIDVAIPREQMTVVTGLSGSGKSSLAFDTIYAEGQRRYVESLSVHARQMLAQMPKPDVERIDDRFQIVDMTRNVVHFALSDRLVRPMEASAIGDCVMGFALTINLL